MSVYALTKLVVVVWGVLFADWQQENEPFQAVRNTDPSILFDKY